MPDPLSLQAIKEAAEAVTAYAERVTLDRYEAILTPSTVSRLVAALDVAHEALAEVAHDRDGMGNPISTAAAALARMEAEIRFDHEEVK